MPDFGSEDFKFYANLFQPKDKDSLPLEVNANIMHTHTYIHTHTHTHTHTHIHTYTVSPATACFAYIYSRNITTSSSLRENLRQIQGYMDIVGSYTRTLHT